MSQSCKTIKKYYAELSDDKTVADIYLAYGLLKASFRAEVIKGKACLLEDVKHGIAVISTPYKAISVSPFMYNKDDKTLSLFITMENSETVEFSSKLVDLVERNFTSSLVDPCGCDCIPPMADDFASKADLNHEAWERRMGDAEIMKKVGLVEDGKPSLLDQLVALENKVDSEIERSSKKDEDIDSRLHKQSETLKHFHGDILDIEEKVNEESKNRAEAMNKIASSLDELACEDAQLKKYIEHVEHNLRQETLRAERAEKDLHREIHREDEEMHKEIKGVYDMIRMQETQMRKELEKLHKHIHQEYLRAKHSEEEILKKIDELSNKIKDLS